MSDAQPDVMLQDDIRAEMRPAGLDWFRRYILIGRDRVIEYIWAINKALGVECSVSDIAADVDGRIHQIIVGKAQNCRDLALTLLLTHHPDKNMAWRKDKRADEMMYASDVVFNWIFEEKTLEAMALVVGVETLSLNLSSADVDRLLFWYRNLWQNNANPDLIGPNGKLFEMKCNLARGQGGLVNKVDSSPAAVTRAYGHRNNPNRLTDAAALDAACEGHGVICCLTDGIGTLFHQVDEDGNYTGPRTVQERRERLLDGRETCHIQIFTPPWSLVAWDFAGDPRPITRKLFGKPGWWVPCDEMMKYRRVDVEIDPRELHGALDQLPPFDVEALIDAIIEKAQRPNVRASIDSIVGDIVGSGESQLAHGHD